MTREMQHQSEKSNSDSKPGFASSSQMDERAVRRIELARVSDMFRNLETNNPRTPGTEQWRRFSEEVFQKIEARPSGFGAKLHVLRDKLAATDSRAMRAVAAVVIVAITLIGAVLVWAAISFALPKIAPQVADALVHEPLFNHPAQSDIILS